jgi:formate hydrogenlyase subunit 6/NADH:ubiquinone oxidoreductase subunit I
MMAQLSRVILRRLKSLVTQPVATVEFPYVVRHAAQGARVSLRNNFSECIGCHRCEAACPTQCIQLTSEAYSSKEKAPKTSKGVVFEARLTSFKIDFNRCLNCGICVETCPTGSLSNEKHFVLPRQENKHLVIDLIHRPRTFRRDQGFEE